MIRYSDMKNSLIWNKIQNRTVQYIMIYYAVQRYHILISKCYISVLAEKLH